MRCDRLATLPIATIHSFSNEAILCTEGALRQLFTSIWGAFDGRALSVSLEKERREGTAAFVSAVSECVGVYARRLYLNAPECTLSSDERISLGLGLVREQWSRLWAETLRGGFGLPSPTLGAILGPPLLRLRAVASGTMSLNLDLSQITHGSPPQGFLKRRGSRLHLSH